jgi:hypothetical protein
MCLWTIYIFPESVHIFSCGRELVDRSWEYINRSQTHECGNWDWGRTIPFLEYCFEFSVLCLCINCEGASWKTWLTFNKTWEAGIPSPPPPPPSLLAPPPPARVLHTNWYDKQSHLSPSPGLGSYPFCCTCTYTHDIFLFIILFTIFSLVKGHKPEILCFNQTQRRPKHWFISKLVRLPSLCEFAPILKALITLRIIILSDDAHYPCKLIIPYCNVPEECIPGADFVKKNLVFGNVK